MTPEEKAAQARAIVELPMFRLVMDEIEQAAINACIHADPSDHERRAVYAAEARAVRNLRQKLNALAREPNPKAVPA